ARHAADPLDERTGREKISRRWIARCGGRARKGRAFADAHALSRRAEAHAFGRGDALTPARRAARGEPPFLEGNPARADRRAPQRGGREPAGYGAHAGRAAAPAGGAEYRSRGDARAALPAGDWKAGGGKL